MKLKFNTEELQAKTARNKIKASIHLSKIHFII